MPNGKAKRNVEGYGNYDPPLERITPLIDRSLVPKRSEGAPTGPVTAPPTPLDSNQLQAKKAATERVAAKATKPREMPPKSRSRKVAKPALLAGGNPQIAKADGDAPAQAYVAAMPGRKHDVERRLDRFSSLVPTPWPRSPSLLRS